MKIAIFIGVLLLSALVIWRTWPEETTIPSFVVNDNTRLLEEIKSLQYQGQNLEWQITRLQSADSIINQNIIRVRTNTKEYFYEKIRDSFFVNCPVSSLDSFWANTTY